ncbi:sugar ABC transporter substrate-binding protein [bacterium]|nr:sugar ABC transporter substrate-binding protein [bacterium]
MKKVIISISSIFVLLLVIFIAFSVTPKNALDEKEIVFWTLQMNDFTPYMTDVIAKFEYEHPDVKIKWIDVPFSEGEKRTLASILSNNPPSLVNLNPDFSSILAQKGALEPISKENLSEFNQSLLKALEVDGKIYAIPWYATSAITIFNKNLLSKAGFNMPPLTYDHYGMLAKDVKEKSDAYIFMPTITENDTILKILNKYGINSPVKLTSKESVDIFNFYKNLYKQKLIPEESVTQTHREALEKYMSGNIVTLQAGANFLNMIKENAPKIYNDTDVAPQVTGKLGQYDFSMMNFVIPKKAKNKDVALEFALFLTNEKNQLALAKQTNILATNEKALQNEYYTKYDEKDLMAKARVLSAKQLYKIEPVQKTLKSQKEVNTVLNTAVQLILLDNVDTKKVLDSAAKKWSKLND